MPYKLINKFQRLDIENNKPAEFFISEKYNKWFVGQIENQLRKGKNAAGVDVILKLSEKKQLQAK